MGKGSGEGPTTVEHIMTAAAEQTKPGNLPLGFGQLTEGVGGYLNAACKLLTQGR